VTGIECRCPENTEMTLADDVEGLFTNSRVKDTFSDKGI